MAQIDYSVKLVPNDGGESIEIEGHLMCSGLDLLLPDTDNAAGAPLGAPRTIERSPINLIRGFIFPFL